MSAEPKREPRSVVFRRQREAEWIELEALVALALNRGLGAVPEASVPRLMVLYRSALSSLAVARRTAMDRHLVEYLEALAGRAYLVVHGSRRPARSALLGLIWQRFPHAVRQTGLECAFAVLVFALGVAVAWALTHHDSTWFYAFVDKDMAQDRNPTATTESLRNSLYSGGPQLSVFASFLFTHNAKIGMMAFALGLAAGVPTILLLFINGLTLGGFLALFAERGLLLPLLGWLLPHGVPEILAMLLCGAAGLSVGRALVAPGELSVQAALSLAGRRAALVVAGSVILFAVAGVIEGIFRQLVMDDTIRFALAAFNATWISIWLTAGAMSQQARA